MSNVLNTLGYVRFDVQGITSILYGLGNAAESYYIGKDALLFLGSRLSDVLRSLDDLERELVYEANVTGLLEELETLIDTEPRGE